MSQGPETRVSAEEGEVRQSVVLQRDEGGAGESEESDGMVFGKSFVCRHCVKQSTKCTFILLLIEFYLLSLRINESDEEKEETKPKGKREGMR